MEYGSLQNMKLQSELKEAEKRFREFDRDTMLASIFHFIRVVKFTRHLPHFKDADVIDRLETQVLWGMGRANYSNDEISALRDKYGANDADIEALFKAAYKVTEMNLLAYRRYFKE